MVLVIIDCSAYNRESTGGEELGYVSCKLIGIAQGKKSDILGDMHGVLFT